MPPRLLQPNALNRSSTTARLASRWQQCVQISDAPIRSPFKAMMGDQPSTKNTQNTQKSRPLGPHYPSFYPQLNKSAQPPEQGRERTAQAAVGRVSELYQRSNPSSRRGQAAVRDSAKEGTKQDMVTSAVSQDYLRHMPRKWQVGDVYAPKDLSPHEMRKWRLGKSAKADMLDMMGMNPLDNYRNFSMISEYMTSHGRIRHSHETGLRPVNQRKMAKTIRRAIGLGIHPSVHQHPEILYRKSRNLPLTVKTSKPTST